MCKMSCVLYKLINNLISHLHKNGCPPADLLGSRYQALGPPGVLLVEFIRTCHAPLYGRYITPPFTPGLASLRSLYFNSSLTIPSDTISVCRSLERSISTLMAFINPVHESRIRSLTSSFTPVSSLRDFCSISWMRRAAASTTWDVAAISSSTISPRAPSFVSVGSGTISCKKKKMVWGSVFELRTFEIQCI